MPSDDVIALNPHIFGKIDEPKRNKYGAKRTLVDGIWFDSKKEADRYKILKGLERAGYITGLCLQPKFRLQDAFCDREGIKYAAVDYRADFAYFDVSAGILVIEDVKSVATAKNPVFRIKWRWLMAQHRERDDIHFKLVT